MTTDVACVKPDTPFNNEVEQLVGTGVGRPYHCAAFAIARWLLAETRAPEVSVLLFSRIGQPVTKPHMVHVDTVDAVSEVSAAVIASECLADWPGVQDRLIAGM